jgi:hypothetical protein
LSDKDSTLIVRAKAVGLGKLAESAKAPAKKIEETLSGAIKQWIVKSGKDIAGFPGKVKAAFASIKNIRFSKDGFLATLHAMDVKALVVARKIKSAFKDAFSGAAKGGIKGIGAGTIAVGEAGGQLLAGGIQAAVGTVTNMIGDANKVTEAANRISIGARGAGQDYVDPGELTAEFYDVAKDIKGITAEGAADAAAKFVSLTGDLNTVRGSLKNFAIAATASGAEVGDVSEAVASISTQFGVTDPEQVKEVLAALIYQGKSGSFELKDAAALFQRLAASGASFGIPKDAQGVKTLGGLTQIARSGTGSGEQAATAVESLLTNLKVKSDDLKAAGVKVYDKGKVRDLPSILTDAISKVGGKNIEAKNAQLASIFGEQGIRAINPLVSKYQTTFDATKGDDKAKQAAAVAMLKEEFDKAINAAGTWADVMEDSARSQENNSAQLTHTWETLQSEVSERLIPTLSELLTEFTNHPDAIPNFVKAIGYAGTALGKLMDWMGMLETGMGFDEYDKRKEAMELRRKGEQSREKYEQLRVSPEEYDRLAQSDPEKLDAMIQQAVLAKEAADQSDMEASRLEQEIVDSQANSFSKQVADWLTPTMNSGATIARKTGIEGEVRVRVMNPNDLKTPAPGSPAAGAPTAPGYTRGG